METIFSVSGGWGGGIFTALNLCSSSVDFLLTLQTVNKESNNEFWHKSATEKEKHTVQLAGAVP